MLCKVFGKCKGCSYLDIPYEKQLELKLNEVKKYYDDVKEIIPSPKIYGYRNKVDFSIGKEKDQKIIIGFREKWYKIIDVDFCLLVSKRVNLIKNLFKEFANKNKFSVWDLFKHKGLLRYLIIRESKFLDEVMVIINTSNDFLNKGINKIKKELNEKEKELLKKFHEKLVEFLDVLKENNIKIKSLIHGINNTISDISYNFYYYNLFGPAYIFEKINNIYFRITPNSFFQTNSYTAKILIDLVLEYTKDWSGILYDFYSGMGTFSLPISKNFDKIYAIEENKESLENYEFNIEYNNLDKNKFILINSRVENFRFKEEGYLILDPPRNGVSKKVLNKILKFKPKEIIYISCNYKTFFRDFDILKEKYKIEDIKIIDQFPHTKHVEIFSLLKWKENW